MRYTRKPMRLNDRLHRLERIYRLFDDATAHLSLACKKGCAVCCTRNVTLTSLEGRYILEGMSADMQGWLTAELTDAATHQRFIPRITTNRLARLCREGHDIPEEILDPSWRPCPLLENDLCRIYPRRPLGCRSLVSTRSCLSDGVARIDPFTLTVVNVFMQMIEHLDAPGVYGNLTDMLLFLHGSPTSDGKLLAARADANRMAINIPAPVLMVPAEHRGRILPLAHALEQILSGAVHSV